jgi:hypothetical protein
MPACLYKTELIAYKSHCLFKKYLGLITCLIIYKQLYKKIEFKIFSLQQPNNISKL